MDKGLADTIVDTSKANSKVRLISKTGMKKQKRQRYNLKGKNNAKQEEHFSSGAQMTKMRSTNAEHK